MEEEYFENVKDLIAIEENVNLSHLSQLSFRRSYLKSLKSALNL
jgi:hypothetical protein